MTGNAIRSNWRPRLVLSWLRLSACLLSLYSGLFGQLMYVACGTGSLDPHVMLWGYSIGAGGGLTPLAGSPFPLTEQELVNGGAFAIHPSGSFFYMGADIRGYIIDGGTGALTEMSGSPFGTTSGNYGSSRFAITPSGDFLYTVYGFSNIGEVSVLGYRINRSTGGLTPLPGSPFPFRRRGC
jgi:hypothetical protein